MVSTQYPQTELTGKIIGCAMEVHKTLGNGFQEKIHQKSLAIELNKQSLNFIQEHEMAINYKGHSLGKRSVDFFIGNKSTAELKAVILLDDAHLATGINYLEASGFKIGLLINFEGKSLQFKHVINLEHYNDYLI